MQGWAWVLLPPPTPFGFPPAAILSAALAITLLCVGTLFGRGRLLGALALPLAAWMVFWIFPMTANHSFLVLVLLGLSSFLDSEQPEEEALLLQSLRWVAVLIFVWAGLQKALHGLYFRGEFLAWMIGHGVERWADVFGWLLPSGEVERLRGLPRYWTGAGPYRVESWPFWLAANGIWVGEIGLGVGLLARRTRELAALGAIGLVLLIQLSPREFMFALLYTNLLLLFVPGEWNRRLLPLFLAAYACLLAALLGLVPGDFLLKADGTL